MTWRNGWISLDDCDLHFQYYIIIILIVSLYFTKGKKNKNASEVTCLFSVLWLVDNICTHEVPPSLFTIFHLCKPQLVTWYLILGKHIKLQNGGEEGDKISFFSFCNFNFTVFSLMIINTRRDWPAQISKALIGWLKNDSRWHFVCCFTMLSVHSDKL